MDDARRFMPPKDRKVNGIVTGLSNIWHVFMLSAKDGSTTQRMAKNLRDHLHSLQNEADDNKFLESLAFTLDSRRTVFPWRVAIPAQTLKGLMEALDTVKPAHVSKAPRLGFVFNGQGAQWYAMGRELMSAYPVFKRSLQQGDKYLRTLGAPFSLIGMYR